MNIAVPMSWPRVAYELVGLAEIVLKGFIITKSAMSSLNYIHYYAQINSGKAVSHLVGCLLQFLTSNYAVWALCSRVPFQCK